MTNHTARLYAFAVALVVLFLTWAIVAAKPWARTKAVADPRVKALIVRQHRLRRETVVVRRLVALRWQRYRVRLRVRRVAIAAAVKKHQQALAAAQLAAAHSYSAPSYSGGGSYSAPSVRTVVLPPVTITRTS
ncbi:MAG: hypothetical protein ACXVRG_04180 [Gaiellaceae bacterium]